MNEEKHNNLNKPSQAEQDLGFNHEARAALFIAKKWAKILAVLTYLFCIIGLSAMIYFKNMDVTNGLTLIITLLFAEFSRRYAHHADLFLQSSHSQDFIQMQKNFTRHIKWGTILIVFPLLLMLFYA